MVFLQIKIPPLYKGEAAQYTKLELFFVFFIISPQLDLWAHTSLLFSRMYDWETSYIWWRTRLWLWSSDPRMKESTSCLQRDHAQRLHNGLRVKAGRWSHKGFRITWLDIESRAVTSNYFVRVRYCGKPPSMQQGNMCGHQFFLLCFPFCSGAWSDPEFNNSEKLRILSIFMVVQLFKYFRTVGCCMAEHKHFMIKGAWREIIRGALKQRGVEHSKGGGTF